MHENTNGATVPETVAPVKAEVISQPKADLRKFNKAEAAVNKTVKELDALVIGSKEDADAALVKLKEAKGIEKLIEDKRVELVDPWNKEVKRVNTYAKELTAKLPPAIEAGKKKVIAWQKEEDERVQKIRTSAREQLLKVLGLSLNPENNCWEFPTDQAQPLRVHQSNVENSNDEYWQTVINNLVADKAAAEKRMLEAKQKESELDNYFSDEPIQETIDTAPPVTNDTPIHVPSFGGTGGGSYGGTKVKGMTKTWAFEITDLSLVPREFLMVDEVKIRKAVAEGARTIEGVKIFQKDGLTIR